MDGRADNGADAEPGSRWLTHRQLAEIRGISSASAIKLALRHGWRKQKDNRGTLRCLVPPEWINPKGADKQTRQRMGELTLDRTNLSESASYEALTELHGRKIEPQIDALGGQIEALKGDIAAKTALIGSLEAQRHDFFAAEARAKRAEEAVAGERARADALRDQLEAAQEELRQAIQTLQKADDARKARGRWARLRAAWRGE